MTTTQALMVDVTGSKLFDVLSVGRSYRTDLGATSVVINTRTGSHETGDMRLTSQTELTVAQARRLAVELLTKADIAARDDMPMTEYASVSLSLGEYWVAAGE